MMRGLRLRSLSPVHLLHQIQLRLLGAATLSDICDDRIDISPEESFSYGTTYFLPNQLDRIVKLTPQTTKELEHRRVHGDDHPNTLITMMNLSATLRDLGELEEAEKLGQEAMKRTARVHGPRSWFVGSCISHYGRTLLAMKRHAEAAKQLEEAYAILFATLGPDHGRTQLNIPHLVTCYEQLHAIDPEAGHDKSAAGWRAKLPSVDKEK